MKHILDEYLERMARKIEARLPQSPRDVRGGPVNCEINGALRSAPKDISDRELTLTIDVSQKSSCEGGIVPHLDELPYRFVGKGEQSDAVRNRQER
jgi:hypothetical protein